MELWSWIYIMLFYHGFLPQLFPFLFAQRKLGEQDPGFVLNSRPGASHRRSNRFAVATTLLH